MLVPLEALFLPGSSVKTTLKRRKPQLPLGMTEHLRDMSGGRGWVHVARKIILPQFHPWRARIKNPLFYNSE